MNKYNISQTDKPFKQSQHTKDARFSSNTTAADVGAKLEPLGRIIFYFTGDIILDASVTGYTYRPGEYSR